MKTYTDEALKRVLARMLPNEYECTPQGNLYIRMDIGVDLLDYSVKDTELLYLVSLVEENLKTRKERENYENTFEELFVYGEHGYDFGMLHATWQQKVTALAQTLGLEIE